MTSLTHKINSIHFNYFLGLLIVQTDCMKDLWVMLDSKQHFCRNADYL
jgi:hypothetical protein